MKRDAAGLALGALVLAAAIVPSLSGAGCRSEGVRLLPVLELYTSEGCSSCPPADRRLAELVEAGIGEVVVALALHVDYWDYLGWRDRFADPRHTARQRARVATAGGRVVYTPQWMLGDAVQLTRSDLDRGRLRARALGAEAPAVTARLAARIEGDQVEVDLHADAAPGQPQMQAWLLGWSSGLRSAVSAGENRDRQLSHVRVLRRWQGPWPVSPGTPLSGLSRLPLESEAHAAQGLSLLLASDDAAPAWALDLPLDDCARDPGPPLEAGPEPGDAPAPRA
ncbi:DUF1223 domain-containing protein [Pseudomarimonas salicorniae]|uniref:DUF1223 domain-containing protein n=1 Tax=Pseudomarimonas salicorniae TaxID=2933270 RepID=A0ABT0GCT9_9GAMM|nr:DUF1223 domain-containing protein [Lysobacter sp. CAU 1642]MCK7592345.1 DUF1223 domain-containing protein [Lysobacter sp. CAU 1642]